MKQQVKMTDEWQVLTGRESEILQAVNEGQSFLLHREVLPYWQQLMAEARAAGFSLAIASAWRGFDRQRLIWNGKAEGQRTVLDMQGKPLDVASLSPDELLFAILRWSAIPGCSRHHWGTDVDVFDSAAVQPGYVVQLTPDECSGCGPFAAMHDWLDKVLQREGSVFSRPYAVDRGGVAPERWHLSCRVVAARYEALLDETRLIDWIMLQDIALKEGIRRHWHEIFHRYVLTSSSGVA